MKTNSVEPVLFQTETGLKKVPKSFNEEKNIFFTTSPRLFIKNLHFFTPKCVPTFPLKINDRKKFFFSVKEENSRDALRKDYYYYYYYH